MRQHNILNLFLWKHTCLISILTNFYKILYVNKKLLLLATFAIFAEIEFSLFFIGKISKIRKNDIFNFCVRKHTSLIFILTKFYKILTVDKNFLLLATFAILVKIEFFTIFHKPNIKNTEKRHLQFLREKTYIPYLHFHQLL